MNSKLLTFFKFILLLAVAIMLMLLAFRGIRVKQIIHAMSQAKIFWVVLSVVPSMIAFVSRAYRWNLLLEPLGYSPSLKRTTYSVLIGYLANLAFPRLGEVTRCGSLSKAEKIPFNGLLGTVVTERLVDVISLLICLAITAVIEYKRLGNFLFENIMDPVRQKLQWMIASPLVLILLIVLITIAFFLIRYSSKRLSGRQSKFFGFVKELIEGLKSIAKLKRPWLFVFHSVLIWALYFLSMYTCFFALPATSGLDLTAALFLLVAGGLGMSAPVQGGIGTYHLLVSQGLVFYGLSKQDGLAFATLVHSSQIILVIVLGSLSLLLLFVEKKKEQVKPKKN